MALSNRSVGRPDARIGWRCQLVFAALLTFTVVGPCRAGSAVQAPLAISTQSHLDFQVTVLTSLALLSQATGVRIQSNSGVLELQRGLRDASEAAPAVSAQLQPRHGVVDTLLQAKVLAGSELITIASP